MMDPENSLRLKIYVAMWAAFLAWTAWLGLRIYIDSL
ncbi:hypothetical protein ABIB87_008853 [Bradyrhizobium sp. JR18.2]